MTSKEELLTERYLWLTDLSQTKMEMLNQLLSMTGQNSHMDYLRWVDYMTAITASHGILLIIILTSIVNFKNTINMSALKHFTVLELGADSESPMVGTIDNVTNDRIGKNLFKDRLIVALQEHFDTEDILLNEIPDLFAGSAYEDMQIEVDTVVYEIRIIETWIY